MPTQSNLPPRPRPRPASRSRAAVTEASRRRAQAIRRRRALALITLLAVGAALIAIAASSGTGSPRRPSGSSRPGARAAAGGAGSPSHPATTPTPKPVHVKPTHPGPYAVGVVTLPLVDNSRTMQLPGGTTGPRTLTTIVRYPALGAAGGGDRPGAPSARRYGPFPLIIFGHGFAVTPDLYAPLLDAWARAGYVVAAPVFPLGSQNAPGGPNENDLPNQPQDMHFVISSLLGSAGSSGPLQGLIDPHHIAVSGQSDGGDTALAIAYDPRFRDPRVDAAVILSGAEIPLLSAFQIAPGGPPLLATQGTADPINLPSATSAFYDTAPAPKYLLQLLGASHLPPYSTEQPQLGIVERVTIDFLNDYLKHRNGAEPRMQAAGNVAGVATLQADP